MPNFKWKKHPEEPVPHDKEVFTKVQFKENGESRYYCQTFKQPWVKEPHKYSKNYFEHRVGFKYDQPIYEELKNQIVYWVELEELE